MGAISRDWLAAVAGLLIGIGVAFLNAWVFDRFINPLISKFQCTLVSRARRVIINIAAFAWAFVLSGLAMLAPLIIFGSRILPSPI